MHPVTNVVSLQCPVDSLVLFDASSVQWTASTLSLGAFLSPGWESGVLILTADITPFFLE